MKNYDFNAKQIWLTGASSGIGRALAEELSERGAKLALSARSESDLRDLADQLPGESIIAPLDVTDPEANQNVCDQIDESFGGLDGVILNAGTCEYVDVERFQSDLFDRVFGPNFFGVVRGLEAAMPLLKQSDDPYIVGMSSASAYLGLPRAEAYGASKVAVKYLCESLMIDLDPEEFTVSVVCPGFVKTPLTEQNDFPMPFLIESDRAARTIADRMERRTAEIHFPRLFTWGIKLISLLPGPLRRFVVRTWVKRE